MLLRLAVRNLLLARVRTTLLGTAIGAVTMLLVLLLSLAQGLEDTMIHAATQLAGGHVTVGGFYKEGPDRGSTVVTDRARLKEILEGNTPGLEYMVDRHRGWAKLLSDTAAVQTNLMGVDIEAETQLDALLEPAAESEYVDGGSAEVIGTLEELADRNTVVLFASHARRLGVGVGDSITVQVEATGGRVNVLDLRVVGIARDLGMLSGFSVLMNQQDLMALYDYHPDTTGAFWLYLDDIDRAPEVMDHLRGVLGAEGFEVMRHEPAPYWMKTGSVMSEDWVGQKLDLTLWNDEISHLTWVMDAFDVLSWLLVLVLMAVIAIGILNTTWAVVRERTSEIGTLRALGMSRWQAMGMIQLEALVLGLAASSGGALLGVSIALALDAARIELPMDAARAVLLSDTLQLSVRLDSVVLSVVVMCAFTAASALWPSLRAAMLPPITAIHHVE